MDNKREMAILSAWEQIEDYTKKEYKDIFSKGLRFRWTHEIYGWTEFGITDKGNPYIVKGGHGTISLNSYVKHPRHGTTASNPIGLMEKVINDWGKIKTRLEGEREKENNIYNFKA